MTFRSSIRGFAVICIALTFLVSYATAEPKQEISHDGLHRVAGSEMQRAYRKPDVDFSQYHRLLLLDCYVAFKKHWRLDHPDVTKHDMARIKKSLAEEFKKVFSEELQKGGYPIVEEAGEDVLIVRPAIIDLDIVAPDTIEAGRSMTFAASAGAMTLYVELHDSVSGEILARAEDRESSRTAVGVRWATRGKNLEVAREALKHWAGLLRKRLDEVHGRSGD